MVIEHVAIWTKDLEETKNFYVRFFNGKCGEKYRNEKVEFESYFIHFDSGARLELMNMPGILPNLNEIHQQRLGFIHIAFSTGSVENVNSLTDTLRQSGYQIEKEPHSTGDGYYESCVIDPEGNRVEITL